MSDEACNTSIVDKNINSSDVLMGDRNAIVIAARASAYGHMYKTKVTCPSCGETNKCSFNLTSPEVYSGDEWEDYEIERLNNGNYMITLPRTEFKVEVKLLTGKEETEFLKMQAKSKNKDRMISMQMKMFIVAIEGHRTEKIIKHFIDNAPSSEARYLREAYDRISPSLRIKDDFECSSCGYEQEMEVPLGADFFWPDK
mgnify:FL=1